MWLWATTGPGPGRKEGLWWVVSQWNGRGSSADLLLGTSPGGQKWCTTILKYKVVAKTQNQSTRELQCCNKLMQNQQIFINSIRKRPWDKEQQHVSLSTSHKKTQNTHNSEKSLWQKLPGQDILQELSAPINLLWILTLCDLHVVTLWAAQRKPVLFHKNNFCCFEILSLLFRWCMLSWTMSPTLSITHRLNSGGHTAKDSLHLPSMTHHQTSQEAIPSCGHQAM